jgi:D-3-phosphoglycerate dehydrogenase
MRVLVAEPFPEEALAELRSLGLVVDHRPGLSQADLARAVIDCGILVVRSTRVGKDIIDAGTSLNLIVRAGSGINTIDVAEASRRGVYVANCPAKNAIAVAELALALILAIERRIPDAVASLRAGAWNKRELGKTRGLFGQSIGIAGLGAVGIEVLARARSFGLVPHAWSKSLVPQRAQELGVGYASSLEQLAARVDILSLHLPLTDASHRVVSRDVLEAMKDGAMLINTARPELVDEAALAELVPKKRLRVGLDVFEGEPAGNGPMSSPLLALPSVYATPHLGASTEQAQSAVARETVRVIRTFLSEGHVPNVVNVAASRPASHHLMVRHLEQPGVLAGVLAVIDQHGAVIEELSNTVFEGAGAACAKICFGTLPSEACVAQIRAGEGVLHVDCFEVTSPPPPPLSRTSIPPATRSRRPEPMGG